jgi:peptidoglycan/xylan/chitin deacetylase (PgdA/CDA1 family)
MDSAEVRRLSASPLFEIGAHTVHHVSLPLVSIDDQHREILESRSALERVVGQPVTLFAYPFGHVSPEAMRTVAEAGFDFAVGAEARPVRAHDHRWKPSRVLSREESGEELDARLRQLS